MGWPQITIIALMAASAGINLVKHGEPKGDNYNVFVSLASNTITSALLYFGGFWG